MPVLPSLNLPGLDVVDFRETATEYHVRAKPKVVSRQCPSCGPAGKVVIHEHKTLSTKESVTVNGVTFEVPLSKFNGQPYVPTAYPSGR